MMQDLLVNFEAQGCANLDAVIVMPLTSPAIALHAALFISAQDHPGQTL